MRWRALYLHSPLGLAPIGTRGLRHRECPSQSPTYSLGAARPGVRGEDAVNRLMICSVPPRCAVPTVEEGEGGRKGQRAFASNFNSAAWLQLGSHRAGPHEARALRLARRNVAAATAVQRPENVGGHIARLCDTRAPPPPELVGERHTPTACTALRAAPTYIPKSCAKRGHTL